MNERDKPDRSEFDGAFREWGRRSPRTSAETAARRVAGRLDAPRVPRRIPRLAWVAATTLVVAAGTWYAVRNGGNGLPVTPPPAVADITALPLDDNVVLWWLDEETPVYFVLSSPDHEENRNEDP
jgi:hypothetical protein